MNNDKTIEDEIKEYRVQFEKSMASIAAYQEKAQIEMAEMGARHDAAHVKAMIEMAEIRANQKKTDKQLSELNSNWGRFVESLVEGSLVELLNERGIEVQRILPRPKVFYSVGDGTRRYKEFDIVVVNGEEVVSVEVKTTLRPNDVRRFVKAMKDFSRYFPEYSSKRVYGAVAYIRCESATDVYAERQGLYVIRSTGDSASITNADNFRPESFTQVSSRRTRGHLRAVPAG